MLRPLSQPTDRLMSSSLLTPFINTTGQCVELFYIVGADCTLGLRVRPDPRAAAGCLMRHVRGQPATWRRFHSRLPAGIHRVEIIGNVHIFMGFVCLLIDDLRVYPCDEDAYVEPCTYCVQDSNQYNITTPASYVIPNVKFSSEQFIMSVL